MFALYLLQRYITLISARPTEVLPAAADECENSHAWTEKDEVLGARPLLGGWLFAKNGT